MNKEFDKAINDLITLCSSEIVRYSMQNFMEGFTIEQRHTIAIATARASYEKALYEIEKYFNNLKRG